MMRPVVLITAAFDENIARLLATSFEVVLAPDAESGQSLADRAVHDAVVAAALPRAEVIVAELDRVDAAALRVASRLSLVVSCRANPANIDLAACADAGVRVATTPGRNADVTADFTLALMLATLRNLPAASAWMRDGHWSAGDVFEPYTRFRGIGLSGRRLGVIGAGAVGRRVIRRAAGFGPEISVYDPFLAPGIIDPASLGLTAVGGTVTATSLDEVLATSDIVTLHVPLLPETVGMIGARELSLLRPHAYLINAARAALVDREALLDTLRSGRIAGAGLDVFHDEPPAADDELLQLPNVTVTPHIAGASDDVVTEHSRMAQAAIAGWAAGA